MVSKIQTQVTWEPALCNYINFQLVMVVGMIVSGQKLKMIMKMMPTIVKLINVMMLLALLALMRYKFMIFLLIFGFKINLLKIKELGIFMLMLRQIDAKIVLSIISKKHIR